jgi:hypothetical protein
MRNLAAQVHQHSVEHRFWVTPQRIEAWAAQTTLFFVLGLGRSGTVSIAQLLNADPKAYVCHEPVRQDFPAYVRAFHMPSDAERYVERFRSKEIFLRAGPRGCPVYGEVNSALRRHVYALRKVFPQARFVHLIRDGRAVVRSMMARATMTSRDPYTATIAPRPGDPYFHVWPEMDRFAKLCWYWQAENAFVRTAVGVTVRFEDLLADYAYCQENLLGPIGVQIDKARWAAALSAPKNQTQRHTLADPSDWSADQQATFWEICGTEMQLSGYEQG